MITTYKMTVSKPKRSQMTNTKEFSTKFIVGLVKLSISYE